MLLRPVLQLNSILSVALGSPSRWGDLSEFHAVVSAGQPRKRAGICLCYSGLGVGTGTSAALTFIGRGVCKILITAFQKSRKSVEWR